MIRNVVEYFKKYGDVVVELKDRRLIVATMDFENEYIRTAGPEPESEGNSYTLFSWTDNCFKLIKPKDIKKLRPMHVLLA